MPGPVESKPRSVVEYLERNDGAPLFADTTSDLSYSVDALDCDDFRVGIVSSTSKKNSSYLNRIAFAVAAIAGITLIAVAACLFPFGGAAFFGIIIPGLLLTAASAAGLIGVAITSCQQRRQEALLITQLHNEALTFAEKAIQETDFDLENHSGNTNFSSSSGSETAQPLNPKIVTLHTLRITRFLPNLHKAMDRAMNRSLEPGLTVPQAFDALLKIDYAIGHYILEELPNFLNRSHHTGFDKEEALTASNCYQHQAFPALLVDYHLIRSNPTPDFQFDSFPPGPEFSSPFYQQGTPPCNWRLLYNHYCTSLRSIPLPSPYSQWAVPDTNPETFLSKPNVNLPWPWNQLKA